MLSYTQRRRRWWRVLTELDPSFHGTFRWTPYGAHA
jgi:hypothetical protein